MDIFKWMLLEQFDLNKQIARRRSKYKAWKCGTLKRYCK